MMIENELGNVPLFLGQLTSPEIMKFGENVRIAILAVGSIEQHGSHLPIHTDYFTASNIAEQGLRLAREKTSKPLAFIAPGIPYGGPGIGMTDWPGTICVRPTILMEFIKDIVDRLVFSGFDTLVILNGCVGNIPILSLTVGMLKDSHPKSNFILVEFASSLEEFNAHQRESAQGEMGHADEIETSIMLVLDPDHVHMSQASRESINHPSSEVSWDYGAHNRFYWPENFKKMTKSGVIGNSTFGTKEKGISILNSSIERFSDILIHINNSIEKK